MKLQFYLGATRFVILVGTVAIKIARPRLFRTIRSFFEHQRNGEVKTRLLVFASNPLIGGVRYVFWGVIANRNESRLWRESPCHFLMPTRYSLLGGLINVQERGQSINQEELDASHPFQQLLAGISGDFVGDMIRANNFCKYEGRICLADYGSDGTLATLSHPQPSAIRLTA